MKNKILYCAIFLFLFISCNNKASTKAEIKFTQDTFHFYKISQGDSVRCVFDFTNTGDADLEIIKLGPSCGCTNAHVSSNRIKPNGNGQVFATYHSEKDSGNILKTIIVESNTKPILHTLFIKGVVE